MCRKNILTIVAVVMAILVLTTASVNAGVISYVQITNDADSGISADSTYTHRLDFGTGSPGALINGVQFNAYNLAANGTLNFNREVSSGDLSDHAGNGNHNVSGGLVNLLTDMYYNGNNAAGGTTTWTLSGLTAGTTYDTRIYTRQWGADDSRLVTIVFDPDGAGPVSDSTGKISQDNATSMGFANGNDAYYINYQFTAVAGEDLVITATQDNLNYSWHLYGMSNQEAADSNVASHPNPANRSMIYVNTVSLTWEPGDAAVSHDIYFSDNLDDVNTATSSDPMGPNDVYKARQSETKYPPGDWNNITVAWDETYYWRIDEVNGVNTWRSPIWSFTVVPNLNYNPTPAHQAAYVRVTADLNWSKGALQKAGLVVYLSTDFSAVDSVAPGTTSGPGYLMHTMDPLVTSMAIPGDLLKGTTYYWRVDPVESTSPLKAHKGDVWSFTTLPFIPISDPNLVGWWTFDEGEGRTALDWSGHDNHGTLQGDPEWVAGCVDGALDFDGSGDYVNIGYSPELSLNEFTLSAWVNIAAEPGIFGVLGTRVGGDTTFDLKVMADNIHGDIGNGTAWINTAIDIGSGDTGTNGQGGDLAVDRWYMITYVIDNTNQQVRLYLDADLKRTITISGTPLLMKAGQSMRISDTGYSEWMNGHLDDVRLYNKALSTAELRLIGGFFEAYDPLPADEASGVSAATTIDWLAGPLAASHDVYFGTSYADVKAGTGGTFRVNLPVGTHVYDPPGSLDAGKLYYWKITEVNDLHPDRKWEGPVWVFRVAGGAGGLLGAYYQEPGAGASPAGFETFKLSRIDPEINWDWGTGSPDPLVDVNDFSCRWRGQVEAKYSEDYTFYTTVDDGERLWIDGQLIIDQWADGGMAEVASAPIALVAGQKYDIVMEQYENEGGAGAQLRWSSPSTSKRIIPPIWLWPPTEATNPAPSDGSTGAPPQQLTLSWTAGVYTAAVNGHRVYFDPDELKVIARTGCQVNNVSTTNPSYALPYTFGLEETYYWAVDEVNGVNSWPGDVWSFTTANNKVIDDMEKYVPGVADNNIFAIWVDGAGDCDSIPGNDTGALVDIELTNYRGGFQAMKLAYDNDGTVFNPCPPGGEVARSEYSKVEVLVSQLPSGIGPDWTAGGQAKSLSLWFYGDQYNSIEPMWVQLTDASNNKFKVSYGKYADEDTSDMNEASWHEWLIDLADFTGVNVGNVKGIAIGIGNEDGTGPHGSGTLYFDDIRLYTPRCVLPRRPAAFAKFDYAPEGTPGGDCVVNGLELEVMTRDWLQSDRNIAAVAPNFAGRKAWYKLDGNANDSSGNAYNGAENGGPFYVAGHTMQAVSLDGVDDYIEVAGGVGITGAAPRTIAGWAKANSMTIADWSNVFGLSSTGTTNEHFDIEKRGGQDQYCIHVHGWEQNILPLDLEWHHFAATYDGTTIVWYGDGIPIGSDSSRVLNSAGLVRMGHRGDGYGFFPGLVDEVTFWDYALTENEIASVRGLGTVYVPVTSPANVSDIEPVTQKKVNFKDYAELALNWLDENEWPLP